MLRHIAKQFVLLVSLLVPVAGYALGLGEIRVTSSLNEPLEAEIALTAVRPGELDLLRVRLAPPESFERVGLDRPFILTQLRFEVGEDRQGRPVVRVTTREAVREPFLNFLVEASWARGRLLREFTVLLDPPVLMPAVITPVEAPATPRRPATPPPRSPSTEAPSYRPSSGTYGPIQRGQTLFEIARDIRPEGVSINQMMLAILEANPDAFVGNINRMLAGHTLRIPDRNRITGRSLADATAEVRRQNDAWRSGATADFRASQAGPAGSDSRLRLRAPGDGEAGSDPAGRAGGEGEAALRAELEATEQELEDERIAREALASRLVELETEAEDLRNRVELADDDLAAVGDIPEVPQTGTEVTQEPEAEPEAEERPVPQPVVESESGLLDLLTNPLVLALLLGIPVVGALAFVAIRRRRAASEASEALGSEESDGFDDDAATQLGMTGPVADDSDATVFGDDAGEPEPEPAAAAPVEEAPAEPAPAPAEEGDDPLTASGIMETEEGDPTSEADFHLAYGLYDQAAELMEGAWKEHPDRVDYLMKLLEIYFAWGKPEEFVKHARDGREKLEAAGEWGNVAILGRQMGGGDEALFTDDGGTMGQTRSGVDLDIAGGGDDEGGADLDMDTGTHEPDDLADVFADADTPAEPEASEPAEEASSEAEAESGNDLEFDLGDFEYDAEEKPAEAPAEGDDGTQVIDLDAGDDEGTQVIDLDAEGEAEAEAEGDEDSGSDKTQFNVDTNDNADEGSLDMDLDLDDALAGLEGEGDSGGIESELSGADDDSLETDFDSMLGDDSGDDASADSGDDAPASDSRLDLARAYIDMGDADGARSLLDEVMADGDEDQKREAKELLDLIG